MPIRWSALKVKEATDKVEEIVAPVLEPLGRAKQVAIEAEKIPNLPDYVKERLARLVGEIERVTGGIQSWDKKPYKGHIHRAIDAIRESLPKGDLAKEQASFQKWLDLFDGDREKAEVAMGIVKPEPKPKETPKEQTAMAQEPEGDGDNRTTQDYIFCEDCQMFMDFWKYDHKIEDTGHANCHWRYVTEEELARCIEACAEDRCEEER